MRGLIIVMLLLSVGLLVGVPHTSHEIEMLSMDDCVVVLDECIGVTSWYTRRTEDRTFVPTTLQGTPIVPVIIETTEISLVGVLAVLSAMAMMIVLAAWLWRNIPGFHRRPDNRCDACDYDLRSHHSTVCPECGEVVT